MPVTFSAAVAQTARGFFHGPSSIRGTRLPLRIRPRGAGQRMLVQIRAEGERILPLLAAFSLLFLPSFSSTHRSAAQDHVAPRFRLPSSIFLRFLSFCCQI